MNSTTNLGDLVGRVALVTGAASGIGRASAFALAAAGAAVTCADRDEPGARETAELITAAGGSARPHALDVSDRAAVAAAVDATVAAYGSLDVLAAIAGILHTSTVLETDDADLDRVLNVNLKGVLHCAREAARPMMTQRSGSIVTMASGAVDTGTPGLLCYSVSKAAVVQLTRVLAAELGPHGIRANAIAPGYVRTPMTAPHRDEGRGYADEEPLAQATPLRRVGLPEDVAGSVVFLASAASAFMTGQILRPNGGLPMPW